MVLVVARGAVEAEGYEGEFGPRVRAVGGGELDCFVGPSLGEAVGVDGGVEVAGGDVVDCGGEDGLFVGGGFEG